MISHSASFVTGANRTEKLTPLAGAAVRAAAAEAGAGATEDSAAAPKLTASSPAVTAARRRTENERLVGMFATLMDGGVPASEFLIDTIALLHETRNWLLTWVSLECASVVFARTGNIDAANVVEGFLEANALAWGGIPRWSEMRTSAMSVGAVSTHLDADRHRAAGASTDPYEIVSFTLQQLDER